MAGGLLGTVSDRFLHYCGINYLRLGAFSLAGLGCSLAAGAGIGDVGGMGRAREKGFGAAASSLSTSLHTISLLVHRQKDGRVS